VYEIPEPEYRAEVQMQAYTQEPLNQASNGVDSETTAGVSNQAAAPPIQQDGEMRLTSNETDPSPEKDPGDDREAKLYVDVNVANFGIKRIIVYEGDTVESLVADFTKKCPIDEFMIDKLKLLLQQ